MHREPRRRSCERNEACAPPLRQPTFYLVGSGAMIRDVKAGLVARGVDRKRQIRNEVFFA